MLATTVIVMLVSYARVAVQIFQTSKAFKALNPR